ncbi:MAG: SGNH/GDSL hydrolase family protein [Lachnospiraceae bacterium]|nr:SGNH/GDSL hydrolase family protein [Lachnospiraceae bacterium]
MGKKAVTKIIMSAIILIGALFLLQRLLIPKYVDGVVEGAMVQEYYDTDKAFDVVFIGDCEVYENFSPMTLWDEYGINSYIRGSAEQYIFQSYYLLEDTLSYEKPKVVVFNIQSLQFDSSRSEAYNRMSIDGMRWSKSKIGSIKASMTDEEHFVEYVFPILRFHSRWKELNAADVEYMFKNPKITFNGYYMRVDAKPAENVPKGKPLGDYSFGDNAWKYLDMMRVLCEENDIKLLFIKAPSLYPYWYPEWDEQVVEYANEHGIRYINFLDHTAETGLDYNTDTYDGGLHMNLSGAEKCAEYIGEILSKDYNVPDRRGDSGLEAKWDEVRTAYNAEIEAQREKYGIEDGR